MHQIIKLFATGWPLGMNNQGISELILIEDYCYYLVNMFSHLCLVITKIYHRYLFKKNK